MGLLVAAASVMQLGASSPLEALVMQFFAMVGELFEYATYLQGQTHIEKWTSYANSFQTHVSNATSRVVEATGRLGSSAAVAPAPAGANHAEGESPTELATTVANTPEEVRKQERLATLTSLAIAMGVMEGSASGITLGLFLLLPLQPSEVGQPETETNELLLLWFITFVFEVLIPEGLIAYFSQVTSRAQAGRFGDVVVMLKSEKFSKQNQLVIGIVTVGTVVYMHRIMIESLCPTPWEDTGKGLMSLAACCSDEIDGAVPCDYVG